MTLYCYLSVFSLIYLFTLLFFGWCFPLSPLGVEPPALPCGLAWGSLPFFCGTMASDLPGTIVLDASKFPAAASRVDISSAIVNRFTAYKVNAVQFVGNLARIFESSDIGNVDNCLVNDNNGDTASSENGETIDIIIDAVNSDSNNIVTVSYTHLTLPTTPYV